MQRYNYDRGFISMLIALIAFDVNNFIPISAETGVG